MTETTNKTVSDYNSLNAGKAWEIVAGVTEAEVKCADCLAPTLLEGAEFTPVFSSDKEQLIGLICDTCEKSLSCPRCLSTEMKFPALSRTDNSTKICSPCGQIEGIEDLVTGQPLPKFLWAVND